MGYTHYWEPPKIKDGNFAKFSQACKAAFCEVQKLGVKVAFELDSSRPPSFTREAVRFNGVGDEGHETFYVSPHDRSWFCKTARKPYDILVVACLCLLEHITGATVSSDGDREDWLAGWEIAKTVDPTCPLPAIFRGEGDFVDNEEASHGYGLKLTVYLRTDADPSAVLDAATGDLGEWLSGYLGEEVKVDEQETGVEDWA